MKLSKIALIIPCLIILISLTACSPYNITNLDLPTYSSDQLPSKMYLNIDKIKDNEVIATVNGEEITKRQISAYIDISLAERLEYVDTAFNKAGKRIILLNIAKNCIYSKPINEKVKKENWLKKEHNQYSVDSYMEIFKHMLNPKTISTNKEKVRAERYKKIMQTYNLTEQEIIDISYNATITDYYMNGISFESKNPEVSDEDAYRETLNKEFNVKIDEKKLDELIKY